jgi:exonuclease SbcC
VIPVRLTLEGIYSYQAAVTIDFRRLTAAQLFGIFGPVGSGKSTILEAMTLALYGESARLSRADNRSTNMLNLRSDRLAVDFIFLDRSSRQHRFTVEAKRNRTRPEEVGSLARRAYRLDPASGDWVPLDHTDGERVLGLSYANFRRTTIIPQGRFQEFLQLGPKDRTEMMKELFQLERFDLFGRTRELQSETSTRLTAIESALGELPEEAESLQTELTARRDSLRSRRDDVTAAREAAAARRRRLEERRTLFAELEELLRERLRLDGEAESRARREERVALLRLLRDEVAAPWEQRVSIRRREAEAATRLEEVARERSVAATRKERLAATEEDLARRLAGRPALEALGTALGIALERRPVAAELDEFRRRHREGAARREALAGEREQVSQRIEELREGLPDQQALGQLAATVEREERAAAARRAIATRRRDALSAAGLSEGTPGTVARERERLEGEIRSAEEEERRATIRAHVAGLAGALVDGEPCPVCGSIHHPGVLADQTAHVDDPDPGGDTTLGGTDSEAVAATKPELDGLTTRLHTLIHLEATLASLAAEESSLAVESAPRDGATAAAATVLPDDPAAAREWISTAWKRHGDADRLARRAEEITATIAALDGQLAGETARIEERERTMGILDEREAAVAPLLDDRGIAALREAVAADRAEAVRKDLSAELDRLEADRDRTREALAAVGQDEARLGALEDERRRIHEEAVRERSEADRVLAAALEAVPFGEEDVPALIEELPALPRYEEELRSARERLVETDRGIATLREKLAAAGDPIADTADLDATQIGTASAAIGEELDGVSREITALQGELEELNEQIGAIGSRLESIATQIARRDELRSRREALQIRRDNLGTLLNLFRGAGFVGYVAQVYLEQLVAAANDRFRRLSRNQLELALSGDRDIAVIDHLNGGRRRSVKTLSGGQTFQAALCLALALVDSIDGSTAGDQPAFFFLDEGFGSLDGESLREVFDTLKNLRQENRIIGIISHVEALQQEIDAHLTIHLDEDRGSRIRTV